MALKPNHKPMGIAERSIFMLGFFFGERQPPEQILKAEDYSKVTKAGKAWSLLKATKHNYGGFFIASCFKVLSRIANKRNRPYRQRMLQKGINYDERNYFCTSKQHYEGK